MSPFEEVEHQAAGLPRRYIERDNTRLSFTGDILRSDDDGGTDADIVATS
jgi:hypothetical protein